MTGHVRNGHHHCPSCDHCVALHIMIEEVMYCRFCHYLESWECEAEGSEIDGILAGQYIDLNREIIEEVGI